MTVSEIRPPEPCRPQRLDELGCGLDQPLVKRENRFLQPGISPPTDGQPTLDFAIFHPDDDSAPEPPGAADRSTTTSVFLP